MVIATNISMMTTTQSAIAADLDAFGETTWFTASYMVRGVYQFLKYLQGLMVWMVDLHRKHHPHRRTSLPNLLPAQLPPRDEYHHLGGASDYSQRANTPGLLTGSRDRRLRRCRHLLHVCDTGAGTIHQEETWIVPGYCGGRGHRGHCWWSSVGRCGDSEIWMGMMSSDGSFLLLHAADILRCRG